MTRPDDHDFLSAIEWCEVMNATVHFCEGKKTIIDFRRFPDGCQVQASAFEFLDAVRKARTLNKSPPPSSEDK